MQVFTLPVKLYHFFAQDECCENYADGDGTDDGDDDDDGTDDDNDNDNDSPISVPPSDRTSTAQIPFSPVACETRYIRISSDRSSLRHDAL